MSNLRSQTLNLEQWLIKKALPIWSTIGINPDNFSVFEQLDSSGYPDRSVNIRSRVQARQIFVFSSAQLMGWSENASDIVSGIRIFLDKNAKVDGMGTGYAHLLAPNGQIIDPKKDTYDFAFFLLSCAYQFKAFANIKEHEHADRLLQHLESKFKGGFGGWMEGDYPFQYRRQNPHMHLFEAFLSWYEISQDAKWLAKAGQIFTLFESTFYDSKSGVLREYFNEDWTLAEGDRGKIIEPGHMFEWVWLLRWYEKLTGASVSNYCSTLYNKGMEIGLSTRNNLVFDEVETDGKVIKSSKRLWPVTELIKASIVQAESSPEEAESFEKNAAAGIQTLFGFYFCKEGSSTNLKIANNSDDQYVDSFNGRYIDQLDENDNVTANHSPASTLYHITMAAIVAVDYLKRTNRYA